MPQKVNVIDKFSQIRDYWSPHIVSELNGQQVKLVKFKGSFVWHHHEHEDEMFLVIKGRFMMKLRSGDQWVEEGEFITIPRGVEHCPFAEEEVCVMLFEPASTLNTGNAESDLTKRVLPKL